MGKVHLNKCGESIKTTLTVSYVCEGPGLSQTYNNCKGCNFQHAHYPISLSKYFLWSSCKYGKPLCISKTTNQLIMGLFNDR